jgi:hypothetical protein
MATFFVWVADLNSLYEERPRQPILAGKFSGYEAAYRCMRLNQAHDSAAWICADPVKFHGVEQ